jgi:hypothetical protein
VCLTGDRKRYSGTSVKAVGLKDQSTASDIIARGENRSGEKSAKQERAEPPTVSDVIKRATESPGDAKSGKQDRANRYRDVVEGDLSDVSTSAGQSHSAAAWIVARTL